MWERNSGYRQSPEIWHLSGEVEGKPVPETMSRANGSRSKLGSAVEHVFPSGKGQDKARYPYHWHQLGGGENRRGKHRLQHA